MTFRASGRVHRKLLQPAAAALGLGLSYAGGVRAGHRCRSRFRANSECGDREVFHSPEPTRTNRSMEWNPITTSRDRISVGHGSGAKAKGALTGKLSERPDLRGPDGIVPREFATIPSPPLRCRSFRITETLQNAFFRHGGIYRSDVGQKTNTNLGRDRRLPLVGPEPR